MRLSARPGRRPRCAVLEPSPDSVGRAGHLDAGIYVVSGRTDGRT